MTLASETAVPLRHADRFFIDGHWVAPSSDATFEVIDSSTEQVYFRVPEAQPGGPSTRGPGPRCPTRNGPSS
jgi:aldehyde dehydrogenase (NAD+)